jgi:hypothetical protein
LIRTHKQTLEGLYLSLWKNHVDEDRQQWIVLQQGACRGSCAGKSAAWSPSAGELRISSHSTSLCPRTYNPTVQLLPLDANVHPYQERITSYKIQEND